MKELKTLRENTCVRASFLKNCWPQAHLSDVATGCRPNLT